METLNIAIRIATISQLWLLSIILLCDRSSGRVLRFIALFSFCVGNYILAPLAVIDWNWGSASYPILLFALMVPPVFLLLTHSLFDDEFRISVWLIILILLYVVFSFSFYLLAKLDIASPYHAWLFYLPQSIKLVFLISALLPIFKYWRADLVNSRRILRYWIILFMAIYIFTVVIVEFLLAEQSASLTLETVNALLIAMLTITIVIKMLGIRQSVQWLHVPSSQNSISGKGLPANLDQTLIKLVTELEQLMENQKIYKEHGLAIKQLAAYLGVHEYKLRQAINEELNYRNFNQLLNQYRINDVIQAMKDPDNIKIPIITLALDAGYQSLAPFNKAFKEITGDTPSNYRKNLHS